MLPSTGYSSVARRFGWVIMVLALLAGISPAAAYRFEDLEGKWCGDEKNKFVTNQIITRDSLTIVHRNDNNATRRFQVIGFEILPNRIRLNYRFNDRNTFVEYGNFSPDFQSMIQLPTTEGPTYYFTRC